MTINFSVTFEGKKDRDMNGSLGVEGFRDDKRRFSKMGREIIQNSFDQKNPENDYPAEVKFKYVSNDNVSDEAKIYLDKIFEDLRDNWNPSPLKQFLNEKPKDYSYMVISDYNTSGMTGGWGIEDFNKIIDLLEGYVENTLTKKQQDILNAENFLSFKRGSGQSIKGGDKLGSRGVGKWAYLYASQLMTLLMVSKRQFDNKTIMSGVTRLESNFRKPDTSGGSSQFCLNLGDWGLYDEGWGDAGKVPVVSENGDESREYIQNFTDAFDIDRSKTGTDFIIPFVEPDYSDIDNILMNNEGESNIEDFYRAISQGRLKISYEGFSKNMIGKKNFTFDSDTLNDFLLNHAQNKKFIDFVNFDDEHRSNIKSENFINMKDITTSDKTINLSDFHEGDFSLFKERLSKDETVTLRIPVEIIYLTKKPSVQSHYYVSLKNKLHGSGTRDDKRMYRDVLRIRDGINYRHKPRTLTERYYCLVEGLKEDQPIYELIRKSEDGAHDKLQEENHNLRGVYQRQSSKNIIMAIKNTCPALCQLLKNEEQKTEDTDLAKQFFPIDSDPVPEGGGRAGGGGGNNNDYGNKLPDLITCTAGKQSFSWNPSSDITDDEKIQNYYEKGIRWDISFMAVSVKDKTSTLLTNKINLNNTDKFNFKFKNLKEISRADNKITIEAMGHDFSLKLKYDLPDGFRNIKTTWNQSRNK